MKISAMVHILVKVVDNRVVADGVYFVFQNPVYFHQSVVHGPEYLGNTPEGVVFLYFVRKNRLFDFTMVEVIRTLADQFAVAQNGSHGFGYFGLARMLFYTIQFKRKMIVKALHQFVRDGRQDDGAIEKFPRVNNID